MPAYVHSIFEFLAISLGFRLYLRLKGQDSESSVSGTYIDRIAPLVGAMFGALVGSKVIALANEPQLLSLAKTDPQILISGKGIVGALAGGWICVEVAKLFCGIKERTGDIFVLPLIVGMAIGRVGCFLSGGFDKTYGIETKLPWAIDFGDGVLRHPCQVYEILVLLLIALTMGKIAVLEQKGDRFRYFMVTYMIFRFFVDFIKPVRHLYLGFDAEQVVALTILLLLAPWMWQKFRASKLRDGLKGELKGEQRKTVT